ncbi:hydrogenase maturation nickel metallochaperone HypA [Geodermatophilus sp. YIM 151500]|uniref:hydrogenase maturation nickel metallochaperone HypA/HybF n=1 Tax=Geodermatophilus sp. YIM 151500 TaxID=2984531 RepID=UPI0021E3C3D3|nr:hydrogenase maturation nickel metallochaperone HypA [Geodermatophilus sp. YIM 151500]MCV2487928.1 hydrogenase maturation nickel metallochaperone HypA [Geodermatophilus sp. YIM 151500]
MHELAITQAVVDAVVGQLGDARATAVHLRIGRVSGVETDAVRFCFDLVAAGTPVAGARLEIEEPTGTGTCDACGAEFAVEDLLLGCPCGSLDVHVTGGDELLVTAVEVA